ncbi:MAG TPA: hypothetical protein VGI05_00105 [Streptosporangiaceae bacterium]|jgi:hypothetical protein
MKVLLVMAAAAAALAVGCGGATPSPAQPSAAQPSAARQSPARPDATASAPVNLTRLQACQQLRDDLTRNQGVPDIPMLRRIADHVTAPRMAADARTAVRDIDHTGVAQIALALLRDECARAGVRIPAR